MSSLERKIVAPIIACLLLSSLTAQCATQEEELTALVKDLAKTSAAAQENQNKIDARVVELLATMEEARILASRTGGGHGLSKAKPPAK